MSGDFEEIPLPGDFAPAPLADGPGAFDQASIDALFGDAPADDRPKAGLRAVIESKVISHERLPMLEVVCERMVRSFATAMRSLTADAVDVGLQDLTSARFGDFMGNLPLPAMIGVFSVPEWENYGIVSVESSLIYAIVDALLGGRTHGAQRIEGRAFTTIETNLVGRMLGLVMQELSRAFAPIAPVSFSLDRIETNPRFAAIAEPSNVAAVAVFEVDMDGRGGRFSIVLPYATLEPVRERLLQRFMGDKLGRSNIWQAHMAAELGRTEVSLDIVLGQRLMSLGEVRALAVGQTIALSQGPDDPLDAQCGGVPLGRVQIGQRRNQIAVRMLTSIGDRSSRKPA